MTWAPPAQVRSLGSSSLPAHSQTRANWGRFYFLKLAYICVLSRSVIGAGRVRRGGKSLGLGCPGFSAVSVMLQSIGLWEAALQGTKALLWGDGSSDSGAREWPRQKTRGCSSKGEWSSLVTLLSAWYGLTALLWPPPGCGERVGHPAAISVGAQATPVPPQGHKQSEHPPTQQAYIESVTPKLKTLCCLT